MKYLHTMVRVNNIEESLDFYCNKLGLKEVRRVENEKGRFTLIFLAAENSDDKTGLLELTYNWDPEEYTGGRNFGHLAYSVENIYENLKTLSVPKIISTYPSLDPKRAVTITSGLFLVKNLLKKYKITQLKVSKSDILEGLILKYF